jgi:hypothetical protein
MNERARPDVGLERLAMVPPVIITDVAAERVRPTQSGDCGPTGFPALARRVFQQSRNAMASLILSMPFLVVRLLKLIGRFGVPCTGLRSPPRLRIQHNILIILIKSISFRQNHNRRDIFFKPQSTADSSISCPSGPVRNELGLIIKAAYFPIGLAALDFIALILDPLWGPLIQDLFHRLDLNQTLDCSVNRRVNALVQRKFLFHEFQ